MQRVRRRTARVLLGLLAGATVATVLTAQPVTAAGPVMAGGPITPHAGPGVYMRDFVGDPGDENHPAGTDVYTSPDIQVCPDMNGCGDGYIPPAGSDAVIHVTLRNPTGVGITGQLHTYWTQQGGSAQWIDAGPVVYGHWTKIGANTSINMAAYTTVTFQILWSNVPPLVGGQHFCLLARWLSGADPMTTPEDWDTLNNTRRSNNIAWHNVHRRWIFPNAVTESGYAVSNSIARPASLIIGIGTGGRIFDGTVTLDLGPALAARWREAGRPGEGVRPIGETTVEIEDISRARIEGLWLEPSERLDTTLSVTADDKAEGDYTFRLEQFGEDENDEFGLRGGTAYTFTVDRG